jgi:hypothetical protein
LGSAVQTKGLGAAAVDRRLEVDDRAKHAALEPAPAESGEHGFDGIQPGARRRGEVEHETRVTAQPAHLGVPVGGEVVEMAWTALPAGTARSMPLRKRTNSWYRWGCMHRPDPGALEHV